MLQAARASVLDHGSLDEIMIRWKLAELHMAELRLDNLPADHALRLFIRRDVPTLLQELLRLRPGRAPLRLDPGLLLQTAQ